VSLLDALSAILLVCGAAFYVAGTVGVLRFPDVYARLHALTKVDNLGLGLLVAGLALRADSVAVVAKMLLVWALTLAASATIAWLIAGSARQHGLRAHGATERET
jgi:multicomponent Na+:H+ antiporter subunit G